MAVTSAETLMWSSAAITSRSTSTSSSDSETSPFAYQQQGSLSGEDLLKQGGNLRDEIRCSILQKRIQKGLGGIRLDWKQGGPEALTREEETKRRQRRERNRVAASRCRERRRERTLVLVKETEEIENSNQELIDEIDRLEAQKAQLLAVLADHNHSGQCHRHVLEGELHIDP
ncbi:uncharacterized protein [Diadema antillarum]|uniref:uncharacterized protein n=1 Tax=Diadema antillarum TaxID=105358 RepID=UPI003A88897A